MNDSLKAWRKERDRLDTVEQKMREHRDNRMVYEKQKELRRVTESELAACRLEYDALKKVVEAITRVRMDIIAGAFEKLLEKAKPFTEGLLNSNLEYSFEFGTVGRRVSKKDVAMQPHLEEGKFIPYQAFSGTEELLAFAGLSVALCQDSPIKLVILDEMGRMHQTLKYKVIKRMEELTKKKVIDQFIGVDTSDIYTGKVNAWIIPV